ncbi:transcription termination factor 3, mitochondrial [Bombus pascuorum]|uniref:transcription termination factor 3, mitochondrial n=1 Tax=Bombus pascuorum TaxID=65598 RepID=UPI00212AEEBB|nr:transcription termination factor 3, mitochondrial [Bombus pascuorum]
MMTSRLYTLLHLKPCNVVEIKNFIFQNVSKSSKLLYCSSTDAIKDKVTDINDKTYLSENIKPDNIGYTEKSTNNAFTKESEDIENNSSVTKVHNELQQLCSIESLAGNVCKVNDTLEDIDEELPGPFDHCDKDLSDIGPNITATYNFAKFANDSHTIQQLVKLGVELYKLEANKEILEMFLKLDFERDMKPYIQFLHDCGVNSENLGFFITRYPKVFKENLDDLHTRIRYLRAHNFNIQMIQRIVNIHPPWLAFKTQEIDSRLSYFQNNFQLNGSQTRNLAVKSPKLITYDMKRIRKSTFAVKEEMGFNVPEIHLILLKAPRVMIRARTEVVKTFDYLHNYMELSHTIISQQPQALLCRKGRLERRHRFLLELKRDQYDPTKPLYVSLLNLVKGSDDEFCKNVAKASIRTYNDFLKSL